MTPTDPQQIHELLTRGVEEVFIREILAEKLKSGIPLRIKMGIDPTGPKIHIGPPHRPYRRGFYRDDR
jgi:tyrosyl-tRNA synthetase